MTSLIAKSRRACNLSGNDSWRAGCNTVFDNDPLWLGILTSKGVKLNFVSSLKVLPVDV
jgi:hypothetical protein